LQVGTDCFGKGLEVLLLLQEAIALGLERGGLFVDGIEGLAERFEDGQGGVGILDERIKVAFRQGELVIV
jgi:hypothetical protein